MSVSRVPAVAEVGDLWLGSRSGGSGTIERQLGTGVARRA